MKTIFLIDKYPELARDFHLYKNNGLSAETVSISYKGLVWWRCDKGHEWEEKVFSRVRQKKGGCKICRSLACTNPPLAKELHPILNNGLRAEDITPGAHRKVWWLCPEGHEYNATVKNRAVNESCCPYCACRKVTKSRSLTITHPELAKKFHPTKNGDLTTDKITENYLKDVWWLCDKEHEWQETVQNCSRQSEENCKVCRSLGYLKPELLDEWHLDNESSPYEVPANSNEKFKWKCKKCSHEWVSNVANRFRGSGCPGCSGAAVTPQTSLMALLPEIANEWDYNLNSKTPNDYTIGSTQEVHWICHNGHRYKDSIYGRTKRNRGCPTCKTVAYLCPHLIEEWSPENILSPYEELARSGKEVIWRCKDCSNVWRAKIAARYRGRGCPSCNSGWTIENIRRFVTSLLPYLETLSPAGLYVLFQQNGLLSIASDAKGRSFVQALKTGRFPKEELEKFIKEQPSLVDEFLTDPKFLLDHRKDDLNATQSSFSEDEAFNLEAELPTIETKDVLSTLDSKLLSNLDKEAIDFFIKEAVARIWQHAFSKESEAIQQLQNYDSAGSYPQEVKQLFLADYAGAKCLQIPNGYSFPHQPNLMQRYTAYLVKNRKRLGNWSGTGAGKTLSAVLASRVIGANLTVICCPNNVIENWERNILKIYPDSCVLIKNIDIGCLKNSGDHQFLILNYEFFQQPKAESKLKALIEGYCIDFVIIDEIHYTKQRQAERMSDRKRVIASFLSEATTRNEHIHVLGMSATPVVNNLYEGKTLIELVTGVHHDDLQTKATVSNCISHYQKFVSQGIRWVPQYSYRMNLVTEEVDCGTFVSEIKHQTTFGSMVDLEAILTKAKIPVILKHLRSKTVVYTHYLKDILSSLQEAIERAGWRVAIFTGECKDGLNLFVDGNADVLIASSCVGTGVDRLQHVCNRLIVNSLPWTHAEFEQLIGRFYRQGQKYDHVDVFVPLTFADINGERWSWCNSRWNRIQFKKSIADAAVDGLIPEGNLRTPAQAYNDAMIWLERLARGEIYEIERRKISIPLSGEIKPIDRKRLGNLSEMNHRINREPGNKTHDRFIKDPAEWEHYHAIYREDRKNWPVIPYQEALKWFKARPHMIVGDFGCGEALLANELENKVLSFDHIAINEDVIACDMTHVPLNDAYLDAAIFSLSLMGSNFFDYLKEAHRCLKLDGHLWIAEPTSRIKEISFFKDVLFRLGFDVSRVEQKWKFTFIKAIKSEREINLTALENIKAHDVLS